MILAHKGSQKFEDAYSFSSDSEKSSTLGTGGYGTVRRVSLKSADSMVRAVKMVSKADLKSEEYVRREIAILRQLDHPCICRLLETFEDRQRFYMVMELIDGRELFDEITEQHSLDEKRAMGIMSQIFSALKYCHERNVIHRDLKPENIMVQRRHTESRSDVASEVKLIDFGLAVMCEVRSVRGKAGSRVAGSANYMAPEALKGLCTPASDVFSAGVVMHVMLAGCFHTEEALEGRIQGASWDRVSPEARSLVCDLLQRDPAKRFTAAQAAAHKWTRGDAEISLSPELVSRMMRDFLSFHQSVKLQRAALTALAMQLTNKQLSEHRQMFRAIDSDGNGRISKEELVASIVAMAPLCADDVRVWAEKVFDSIDTDGSREIDYTEWLATAMHENACRSEEAMQAAFRVFDLNGDGKIDPQEFAKVLVQTPEEVTPLLPQFDTNGDGAIDFEEFKGLLCFHAQHLPGTSLMDQSWILMPSGSSATDSSMIISKALDTTGASQSFDLVNQPPPLPATIPEQTSCAVRPKVVVWM
jgi:calcium-dependent protein kinase